MTDQPNAATPKRAARPPGCLFPTLALAVAALAGGVHLMGQWDHVGGGGRAGAVVLVMLGTLLLLPAGLLLLVAVGKWWVKRKLGQMVGPMKDLFTQQRALWAEEQKHRPATDADFAALDRGWYDAATAELTTHGFTHLGDVVNTTIADATGVAPPIRVLASADGHTVAGLYHVRTGGADLRAVDLDSERTDGTFVVTSNTADHDLLNPPPGIQRDRRPADTSVPVLLGAHRANIAGLDAVPAHTLADALAAQARMHKLKSAFRASAGLVQPDEVRRIARRSMPDADDATVDDVADTIADAARRHQQRDADDPK